MSEVGPSLARPPSPASRDGRPRRNATGGPDKEKLKEVREREKVEKRLTEVSGWSWVVLGNMGVDYKWEL